MTYKKNICTLSDSYKMSHWNQYPTNTEYVYSYFEARPGAKYDRTTFFGLQYLIKNWLEGPVVTTEAIDRAEKLANRHFGNDKIFNRARWDYIVEKHGGKLPVEICAVPEGSVIPIDNAMMTVVNTDPNCYWLTNHLETLLCQVWYPSTVATLSRSIKEMFDKYLEETADSKDGIGFMLHDFGMRGVSTMESAGIGGAGHLINFLGTDTVIAMEYIEEYYGGVETGYSVPACYDDKTEILTENGWCKFTELKPKVKVAQYHTDGTIDFIEPTEYFKDRYVGDMIDFNSVGHKYVDVCVTPNHKRIRKSTAKSKGYPEFFVAGDTYSNYSSKNQIIVAGNLSGACEFTPLDQLKIAFQADGSWSSRKDNYTGEKTGTIPIRFSLKKDRKIERLRKILSNLDFTFSESGKDKRGYVSFRIQIPTEINMSKTFDDITLSDKSYNWCKSFIDELQYWDGSLKRNSISYTSTVESNVHKVSAIATLCGNKCQIYEYDDKRDDTRVTSYTVTITENCVIGGSNAKRSTSQYDGFVYCVSVPTKMIIVRRNNKTIVCGNTEHSVMTARGVEGEKDVIKQLIENHPTGILSVVSDSYDIYRCVDQYYGVDFKEEILARDGKFVVRPDSGDPVKVVCGVFVEEVTADSYETFIKLAEESLHDQLVDETPHGECGGDITRKFIWNDKVYSITYSPDWNRYDKQYYYIDNYGSDHTKAVEIELSLEDKGLLRILWDRFGGSINSKGYKVLNPKIGLIWGDGVDSNGIQSILAAAKKIGFSAENLVFGMGGHLLQRHNRDTQRFAFKSSAQKVAGEDWKDIYKDPIDGSKKSKKGKLALIDVPEEINATRYQTVRKETVDEELNILVPVFRNGELLIDYNFNEVIKNSSK